jgi:uncharacterized protein (DUF1800 family)
MRATRRDMLAIVAAASAIASCGQRPQAAHAAQTALPAEAAWRALNRLSFGASHAQARTLQTAGLSAWLDAQLDPDPADEPAVAQLLKSYRLKIEYEAGEVLTGARYGARKELRPLGAMWKTGPELWRLVDYTLPVAWDERWRPADEMRAASLIRAVHAERQLREVLVDFWHNHFNVAFYAEPQVAVMLPDYDRAIRRHVFGDFRKLLGEVARSPAMLRYLNNDQNRGAPANENYARELFELHTLGAPAYHGPGRPSDWRAGYGEDDVKAAARAFTGWTIAAGQQIAGDDWAENDGRFLLLPQWHDFGPKTVLGRDLPAMNSPQADGDAVLDAAAAHPATARFIAAKLVRRLVSDSPPPALIDTAAAAFGAHAGRDDQIAQTLRAIILDPAFVAPSAGKTKRPFEFIASFLRATGTEAEAGPDVWLLLGSAGWRQFDWGAPTGHPDSAGPWINSNALIEQWNLISAAVAGLGDAGQVDLWKPAAEVGKRADALAAAWHQNMLGRAPTPQALAALVSLAPGGQGDAVLSGDSGTEVLQRMILALAMSPAFMER